MSRGILSSILGAIFIAGMSTSAIAGSSQIGFVVDGASVVGGPLAGVSLILDPILATTIQGAGVRILVEIRDVDDALVQDDADISVAVYTGNDLDMDPSNDFSGSEPFEVDPLTLLPDGSPVTLFTPGTLIAGHVLADPSLAGFPIPGFGGTLANFSFEADVTSGGNNLTTTGIPIAVPAVLFESIPAPAPLPGNLLDYLNLFGINEDTDLDGDGVNESFSMDIALTAVPCQIEFPVLSTPFVRGDVNTDGVVNVTDAVSLLQHLFNSQGAPSCDSTTDIDASGSANINDPIVLLQFLFQNGTAPVTPFPACGSDAQSLMSCDSYSVCP